MNSFLVQVHSPGGLGSRFPFGPVTCERLDSYSLPRDYQLISKMGLKKKKSFLFSCADGDEQEEEERDKRGCHAPG